MPVVALVLLWRRAPARYVVWRNTLLVMLVIGLAIFWAYPLMPPRLMPQRGFVDTAAEFFNFGPQQRVVLVHGVPNAAATAAFGNLFAAMPSFHGGWSLWSALAMFPVLRSRWAKALVLLDPLATLFAIVVTANHWILDAVGGWIVLGISWLLVADVRAVAPPGRLGALGVAGGPCRRERGADARGGSGVGAYEREHRVGIGSRRRQRGGRRLDPTTGDPAQVCARPAHDRGRLVVEPEAPRPARWRHEVEADATVELRAGLRERVGQRPPREPRDVAEPVGRRHGTAERGGDVGRVDPALGEPGGGERPRAQAPDDPLEARTRVRGGGAAPAAARRTRATARRWPRRAGRARRRPTPPRRRRRRRPRIA